MTVYVDDMNMHARVPNGARTVDAIWCHMTADTTEELLTMAKRIGLRPAWIQYPGTWKEHFDVTAPKRAQAVQRGATEVTWSDHARARREAWKAKKQMEESIAEAPPEEDLMSLIAESEPPVVTEEDDEPYANVCADHIMCKPGTPDHDCSCHLSAPCSLCGECPALDPSWTGWR